MGNISDAIPRESQTVSAIYFYHERKNDTWMPSSIPVSKLGGPCDRQLWYHYRHCGGHPFEGRMLRLFETGNLQEPRFTEELRGIGCEVLDVDVNTGKQFLVTWLDGHVRGYADAVVLGIPEAPKTWHLGEYKTHKAKSFRALVKHGVRKHKPEHFTQMQVYMHLLVLTRAIYLAVNKDTDELYAERINYDEKHALEQLGRAKNVVESMVPPEQISDSSEFYQCKWCDYKKLCFGIHVEADDPDTEGSLPILVKSCRQCCHAGPVIDQGVNKDGYGRWVCAKHDRALSHNDQLRACPDHLVLPGLLMFSQPFDYDKDEEGYEYIHFHGNDEVGEWYHGRGTGAYTTEELMVTPPRLLGSKLIDAAKVLFDARVDNVAKDPLEEWGDSTILWQGRASELEEKWLSLYGENLLHVNPVKRTDLPTHIVNEYLGGRLAILFPEQGNAEIRFSKITAQSQGIPF